MLDAKRDNGERSFLKRGWDRFMKFAGATAISDGIGTFQHPSEADSLPDMPSDPNFLKARLRGAYVVDLSSDVPTAPTVEPSPLDASHVLGSHADEFDDIIQRAKASMKPDGARQQG